ncbi:hypothetical protein DPMN_031416 [Dreissena polymorpha]|uniref:Uncharacterized protein n=1 Tax=Dreissena polymorpha TaxID=45954 RepID=A0A9D4RHB8_DREPO|nr:hypothetical protein DPMN_031416 [Dreissena polymorpha]
MKCFVMCSKIEITLFTSKSKQGAHIPIAGVKADNCARTRTPYGMTVEWELINNKGHRMLLRIHLKDNEKVTSMCISFNPKPYMFRGTKTLTHFMYE